MRKKPSWKLPPLDTTVRPPETAELAEMVSDDARHRRDTQRMGVTRSCTCTVEAIDGARDK